MTTLVESGSTLKLSVAIREYEDNEEKRKSSAQLDLTDPPKEEVEEPVAAASAHLCTQKLPHPLSVNEFMPIRDTDESQYSIVPANESQASLIPLVRSGSRLRFSAAVDVHEDDDDRIRPNFVNEKLPHIISVNERQANWDTEESQYTVVPAKESYACMIPLVRSEYRLPRGEEVEEPVAAASAHLCTQKLPHPLSVNEFMPIRDTDERQYAIIPANESQASMIALVVSGSRLRLSAAVDVHEDDEE
ncbi:hypothetical protein J6590_082128 [Homalodisca vitripennis]|nr:hypothetical protein J6590_082128 [Homalodisca vitripennis]